MKYSLRDLAWLSRCLFPDDFMKELEDMGVEKPEAYYLSRMLHKRCGCHRNILEMYQETIEDPETSKLLDKYCELWLTKAKENRK